LELSEIAVSTVSRLWAGWPGFNSHQGQWRDYFSSSWLLPDWF